MNFQVFCFLTDFNFDYRFLEGMTGAIFVMWSWRLSETFFIFMFGVSRRSTPAYQSDYANEAEFEVRITTRYLETYF